MELTTWTPVIFPKKEFPRDENGTPFLPGNVVKESIVSAAIYYYIKKDKSIEASVKKLLLGEKLDPETVVEQVKKIITDRYTILDDLEIPEKIEIENGEIEETVATVFNLKKWDYEREFKVEVFKGVVKVNIKSPHLEKLKAAGHSYCEALARMEMKMLKDHPLVENFYKPLLNEMKKWEIPLRIGMWTENRYKGYFLYFWRIKEVRNHLFETLKQDIRPTKVILLEREGVTTGWSELSI